MDLRNSWNLYRQEATNNPKKMSIKICRDFTFSNKKINNSNNYLPIVVVVVDGLSIKKFALGLRKKNS